MFWIHGGAFSLGHAIEYFPNRYMEHDIVFVAIQYRLGPLGKKRTMQIHGSPSSNSSIAQVSCLLIRTTYLATLRFSIRLKPCAGSTSTLRISAVIRIESRSPERALAVLAWVCFFWHRKQEVSLFRDLCKWFECTQGGCSLKRPFPCCNRWIRVRACRVGHRSRRQRQSCIVEDCRDGRLSVGALPEPGRMCANHWCPWTVRSLQTLLCKFKSVLR